MGLSLEAPHKQSSGTSSADRRVPTLDAAALPQRVTCPSVVCHTTFVAGKLSSPRFSGLLQASSLSAAAGIYQPRLHLCLIRLCRSYRNTFLLPPIGRRASSGRLLREIGPQAFAQLCLVLPFSRSEYDLKPKFPQLPTLSTCLKLWTIRAAELQGVTVFKADSKQ